MKKTGFCYNCGLVCEGLFCNPKCEKQYNRKTALQDAKQTRTGKRKGYGLAGSTH